MLRRSQLVEWKDNPRRWHDPAKHLELVESIRAGGLLQPLLVRPYTVDVAAGDAFLADVRGDGPHFQIICGNRRGRALGPAGYGDDDDVPCLVREMSDADALAAACKENGDRDGLAPLEEAAAFNALVTLGLPIEEVAARVGKPIALVRSRLKLLRLHPWARALLELDHIPMGGALVLAQLEHQAEQLEVLRDLDFRVPTEEEPEPDLATKGPLLWNGQEIPGIAAFRDAVAGRQRDLARAPFPILDAELVPAAGACNACPKRSGAQAFLFGASTDDACLDAKCWKAKRVVHSDHLLQAASTSGRMLTIDKTKKYFNEHGATLKYDAPFVDVASGVEQWNPRGGKTWREVIAEAGRTGDIVVAVDPDGFAREILPKKIADEIRPAPVVEAFDDDDDDDDDASAPSPDQAARVSKWEADQAAAERDERSRREGLALAAIEKDVSRNVLGTSLEGLALVAKAMLTNDLDSLPSLVYDDDVATGDSLDFAFAAIDAIEDPATLLMLVFRSLVEAVYVPADRQRLLDVAIKDLQLGDWDSVTAPKAKGKARARTHADHSAEALEKAEGSGIVRDVEALGDVSARLEVAEPARPAAHGRRDRSAQARQEEQARFARLRRALVPTTPPTTTTAPAKAAKGKAAKGKAKLKAPIQFEETDAGARCVVRRETKGATMPKRWLEVPNRGFRHWSGAIDFAEVFASPALALAAAEEATAEFNTEIHIEYETFFIAPAPALPAATTPSAKKAAPKAKKAAKQ